MDNLTFAPAHELAALIRRHQVSSPEVVEAYPRQIDQHNHLERDYYARRPGCAVPGAGGR